MSDKSKCLFRSKTSMSNMSFQNFENGLKAISDWLEGGLNVFVKKFRGGQQFDRQVYFKRGPLAKMGKAVI